MNEQTDLAALVSEPSIFFGAGGERLEIAPLKVRQLPAFARAVAPLMAELSSGDGGYDLAALVAAHGERIITAVAVATGKPEGWVGDMDSADFVRLASAVIEINGDFFMRRLAPAIEQAGQAISRRLIPAPTGSA